MKKILLVCGGGMSTSLLVKKMEAADIYNEYQIKCSDVVSGQVLLVDYDIILLAPHIAYLQNEFVPLCQKVNIPLMLIDSYDYTKMAGKIVLDKAIMLLNEFTKEHPFKVLLLHSVAGAMSDLIVLDMKKKVMSAVLAAAMVVGMAGNVVTVSAEEKYDLTLYSIDTTDPDFEDWLANVEDATGLNINVIAAPTDTDTRQQKITTMLSTGDASVDVIQINDEMSAAFKNSGWLEGLNDTVMTDDIADQFAQGYVKNMITDKDGNIIGVPGYTGYFAFWVNQEIMDEVGIKSIDTKEDFMKYMKAVSKDGRFGYGGSWEKTYAFNELAQFVNMFGGDYFDWTKEENKEAVQFLHDLVADKETSIEQIADKYEQMNPKINDGKYGC